MKYTYYLLLILLAITVSCDDTTDTLGMTLTDDYDVVNFEATDYSVATNSTIASDVVSRTKYGYLGKIKDLESGGYVTCNYMTQFRVMRENEFPPLDTLYIDPKQYDASIEKYKQIKADSCVFVLYITSYTGDSLALMKVYTNELSVPFEEGKTYTTDFDPEAEGMIRTDAGSVHSQMSYTVSNRIYSDAERSSSTFQNRINISLNDPYTDKWGNTYNNYGTYLLRNYYDPSHADSYKNTYSFIHDICPGFYLKHEGGLGSVAKINKSQVIVYYQGHITADSIGTLYSAFAGTEEVIQKSYIIQDKNKINEMIEDESCTYVKSPAGIFTEITLPVDDIMSGHEEDSLNTARLFLPRLNNDVYDNSMYSIPTTLLLLPTDSVKSFFADKNVADYRSSYLSTYSSSTNGYTFGNISSLISKLYAYKNSKTKNGEELPETWNKVTIIPVETSYTTESTSSVLTKVTHNMNFASTKFKKGTEDSKDIKINVIYSKFK